MKRKELNERRERNVRCREWKGEKMEGRGKEGSEMKENGIGRGKGKGNKGK